MKVILLTRGYSTVVDDGDYERVSNFKWHAHTKKGRTTYAARSIKHPDGRFGLEFLHQLLTGLRGADHRDGDGLNNLRSNLRAATTQQNMRGFKRKRAGATSKFRGVCWYGGRQKWYAGIRVSGKQINLGLFSCEKEAALAYDRAARELFGDFATPNFP